MNNQLVSYSSSSSSSSSFCIDSTPSWRYDVFLSFRGEDTRTNFTDHLYKALDYKGVNTFIDSQLVRGDEISPALFQAIEESRISLVIFSETYAASRWCLDELVKSLQCRQSKQQIVLPVFYKVDPSHVQNQTSSFGDEFKKLECKFEDNKKKILAWRSALREAANLSGHPVKEGDYETTLISNIVEDILVKVLDGTYLDVPKYPVGIHSCVQEVKNLLGVDGNGRRVVEICGTSGIGKTTIAKAVYNAIAYKFEGSCFLGDVRESSTSREGLLQLQKTFLSKILRGTKLEIDDVHDGISLIKKLLGQKKILLILDDVDELEQLNNWVDDDCFSEGSRVIITTKDRSLLDFYGGQWIYKVQTLEDDKALELFSWNAFERERPPDDYLSLAQRATAYAQGLPLALNLIGSHLNEKCKDCWQAILDGYDSYNGESYTDIQIILRKIYDAWDYDMQQDFLDIACFFKGKNKDYMLQRLRNSTLNVRQDCIEVLVEKAIITIENNRILMHDLLQKMGKQIVESTTEPGEQRFHEDAYSVLIENPGERRFHEDVYNVLTENQAASAEWTFLFISLCLEILSVAFDQASSSSKPQYALFGMLLAIVGVLIYVFEFIYKGRKGRVELRKLGKLWWFYYPTPPCYKPLGTAIEIYGLVGGIAQCVSSIIEYVYFSQHLDSPFKVSLLPAILVIYSITSRLSKDRMWFGEGAGADELANSDLVD